MSMMPASTTTQAPTPRSRPSPSSRGRFWATNPNCAASWRESATSCGSARGGSGRTGGGSPSAAGGS
jgi:hypothetical protein